MDIVIRIPDAKISEGSTLEDGPIRIKTFYNDTSYTVYVPKHWVISKLDKEVVNELDETRILKVQFECGHFRLDYDVDDDDFEEIVIGQISVCEICPRLISETNNPVTRVRQIVEVTDVSNEYKQPIVSLDTIRKIQMYPDIKLEED